MADPTTLAIESLDALLGNYTAHLTIREQIQVALALSKRCAEMASDLVEEQAEDILVLRGALEEIGRLPTLQSAQEVARSAYALT